MTTSLGWPWTVLVQGHQNCTSNIFKMMTDTDSIEQTPSSLERHLFKPFMDQIHAILRRFRKPSCFPMSLPDYLVWCVSFRRHSPLSHEVVEESNKCKSFVAPIFLREMTPTFLRQIASAIYHTPFGKVWLSFVCYLRLRSRAMK